MSFNFIISLIIIFICLLLIITYLLIKGRISEKYAILWYCMDLIILLVVIFRKPLIDISNFLGFYPLSSLIMSIFIGLLFLLVIALTVMIAGQKKKTTMLIQEISLLKNQLEEKDK